jgi:hypothetical protein
MGFTRLERSESFKKSQNFFAALRPGKTLPQNGISEEEKIQ